MHMLDVQNGRLVDRYAPVKLPPLPAGTKFTTATASVGMIAGDVEQVFFFSATVALAVCFGLLPGQIDGVSVLDMSQSFPNSLNSTLANKSGFFIGTNVGGGGRRECSSLSLAPRCDAVERSACSFRG